MIWPAVHFTAAATFTPKVGEGAYGSVFGAPVVVSCWPEESTKVVVGSDGSDVTSSTRLWCGVEYRDLAAPGSRVEFRGRTTEVITLSVHDPGAIPLPSLLEVTLR